MALKKAKTTNEAFEIQDKKKGVPHGFISWKGTDVCMDIVCKCGFIGHIDDENCYYVKCANCGTIYFCNGHIELIEIEQEPDLNVLVAQDPLKRKK